MTFGPAVRRVLHRLEQEDAEERRRGTPRQERARQVAPTTGRFLFALAASRPGCRVLEIGGSRGYSEIWLASAVAPTGGRVVSLEHDPRKAIAWRANVAETGLDKHAELIEGDALTLIPALDESFELCFLDAEKEEYERLAPGAVVVADNVLSHAGHLAAYSRARQCDSALASVTVPLDRGLELSVLLS